jgi:hypothetical protein
MHLLILVSTRAELRRFASKNKQTLARCKHTLELEATAAAATATAAATSTSKTAAAAATAEAPSTAAHAATAAAAASTSAATAAEAATAAATAEMRRRFRPQILRAFARTEVQIVVFEVCEVFATFERRFTVNDETKE